MNKAGEANRSVRNTKDKIRKETLALLEKKCIKDISVKELTERIDISRGTFYCHYSDIYHVLEEIEDQLILELNEIINSIDDNDEDVIQFRAIEAVFTCLQEHVSLVKILLDEDNPISFLKKIKDTLNDSCSNRWTTIHGDDNPELYLLFNTFLINGMTGLIEYWIDSDMKKTPQELAEFAANFIAYGASTESNLIYR